MANIKNRPGVASPSRQNNVLPLAGHAKFSQPPSRKPARPRTGGVTPTGLEEWTARGRTLYSTLNRTQWEIGAWFNGGHRYGQRKAVVTAIGFDYHTAKNYGWVERKVERSRRRDLSFTHHEKVAALLPDDQVRWLDIAVRDKLSTT
ncbi:MAG TPA: hypothetical protein VFC01_32990, partial [Mycobacterium sp.]|nr:hypothetical protein [Mycobacterium sp.]